MDIHLPMIAGFISTTLFALGTLPMLTKALRTKNLASYSLGNILMSNVGNLIHSIYVFNLPPGPIWFLHGYNLLSTCDLMLLIQFGGNEPTWEVLFLEPCRSIDDNMIGLIKLMGC